MLFKRAWPVRLSSGQWPLPDPPTPLLYCVFVTYLLISNSNFCLWKIGHKALGINCSSHVLYRCAKGERQASWRLVLIIGTEIRLVARKLCENFYHLPSPVLVGARVYFGSKQRQFHSIYLILTSSITWRPWNFRRALSLNRSVRQREMF